MKRYIVLSVNSNQDYYYFLPLTFWAWIKLGWTPIIFYEPSSDKAQGLAFSFPWIDISSMNYLDKQDGYRSATVAQISRLYAACLLDDEDLVMTGDIDLLPLSDYWSPNVDEKTVYGFDLTGYTEYPICFISMKAKHWKTVMLLDSGDYNGLIKRDLDSMPNAKSEDFYKWWGVDQQLITQRLKPFNPTLINRGQYSNGYATGRMDRGNWNYNHTSFTDAHLFQQLYFKQNQDKFDKTMELLTSIWPDEDFGWWIKYTEEFRRLTGHA